MSRKVELQREWRKLNPEKTKYYEERRKAARIARGERHNEPYAKKREMALAVLGNKCIACLCNDTDVLHIDHINGGGRAERKTKGTECFLNQIISKKRPDVRLLCACCNERAKRYGGDIKKWPQTTLELLSKLRDFNASFAKNSGPSTSMEPLLQRDVYDRDREAEPKDFWLQCNPRNDL